METIRSHGPASDDPGTHHDDLDRRRCGDDPAHPSRRDGHEHPRDGRRVDRPAHDRVADAERQGAAAAERTGSCGLPEKEAARSTRSCPSSAAVRALRVVGVSASRKACAARSSETSSGALGRATARPAGRRRPRWPTGRPHS